MNPHICPVCNGKGLIDRDFYPDNYLKTRGTSAANIKEYVTCRSCNGTGVVWSPKESKKITFKGTEQVASGDYSIGQLNDINKGPVLDDGFLGKVK